MNLCRGDHGPVVRAIGESRSRGATSGGILVVDDPVSVCLDDPDREVLADPELARQDVFCRMLQAGLQDLIDAEATARIGAAPRERTPERTTRRDGVRPKTLATPAGEVDLAIPKLREGPFFPSLLHPRRRVDKALYAVICQAWIDKCPPARSTSWFRALGRRHRHQPFDGVADLRGDRRGRAGVPAPPARSHLVPVPVLGATYLDVRHRGRVTSQALVVATGVSGDGRREILGMALGGAETTDFWTEFLRPLREHGLKVATYADRSRWR